MEYHIYIYTIEINSNTVPRKIDYNSKKHDEQTDISK